MKAHPREHRLGARSPRRVELEQASPRRRPTSSGATERGVSAYRIPPRSHHQSPQQSPALSCCCVGAGGANRSQRGKPTAAPLSPRGNGRAPTAPPPSLFEAAQQRRAEWTSWPTAITRRLSLTDD